MNKKRKYFLIPVIIITSQLFTLILSEFFFYVVYQQHITLEIFYIGLFDSTFLALILIVFIFLYLEKTENIKKQNTKLNILAYKDGLTNLYNRLYFEDKIKNINIIESIPLSVIMLDLDGLKLINDAFGHQVGDQVLKCVANTLLEKCRFKDDICRIGGDEFLILLPKTSNDDAKELAKIIEKDIKDCSNFNFYISLSLGVDTLNHNNLNFWEVFAKAEENMYTNKVYSSKTQKNKMIQSIISILFNNNEREESHAKNVSQIAKEFATYLNLSNERIEEIKLLGYFHDIGKIGINSNIFNKKAKLTDEEWIEIKSHSEKGYLILSKVNDFSNIADYVLLHHERWDGLGYPRKLKKDEIPFESKLLTLVDAYEAMTSERPYRKALTKLEAINEIKSCSGSQFDPQLAISFIEFLQKKSQ